MSKPALYQAYFHVVDAFGADGWEPEYTTTIAQLIAANKHDEYVIKDMVPILRKLKAGESHVFNLGAGGLSKFTRLSAKKGRR